MFKFNHKKDLAESIRLINSAIKKEHTFKKYNNKQILEYVMKEVKSIVYLISDYLAEDSLYIHNYKKSLLLKIVKELNHLVSSCKYYYNYFEFDQKILLQIISQINTLLDNYSKYGSLYVFRHCETVKRTDAKGIVYDGIPTKAIKDQAMKRAKQIIDEILISPQKVKIILYHTEKKRTKIFGEIIIREIMLHHHCKDKIEIINKGYDHGIRFNYFTDEAVNEVMPTFKQKGSLYCFFNWYFSSNEFKSFKFQPKPNAVISGIKDFVATNHKLTLEKDYYTIVIGITHSWIIDAYLVYNIPGLENQIKHVIETASFFKVECGELNYLGKWVKI